MIIERAFVDLLASRCNAPTYYGRQPQPADGRPAPLPVIIVNRITSRWFTNQCGTDVNLTLATIQVDYYGATAEASRRLADLGRAALANDLLNESSEKVRPALDNESVFYDSDSAAYRTMQEWTAATHATSL